MQLTVTTTTIGGHRVVTLEGIADLSTVPKLQTELRREIGRSGGDIVLIDIDGLTALDDVALGVLLGAAAAAREQGGDLEIVTASPRWRERFAVTRFEHAVTIRASVV